MLASAVAAFSLSLAVAQPPPRTFPSFDLRAEHVVLGPAPIVGAIVDGPGEVVMRGNFVQQAGALRLVSPAPVGESTWFSGRTIADGIVRTRFVIGERTDQALVLRAILDGDELESGLAVAIEKDRLRLSRWTHKLPTLLGIESKIEGRLAKGDVLEIVVVLAGPVASVTVFDGSTLRTRAHADVQYRGARSGLVGVRVAREQSGSGVEMLSLAKEEDIAAQQREAQTTSMDRLLVFSAPELRLLPADLRGRVVAEEQQLGQDVVVLVTDPVGLERALRAGITPVRVKTTIPWRYVDPSLRARLGKPPTKTATGFRIDEGYKDAELVEALLRAYAERYPDLAMLIEMGRSVENRPIWALKISDHVSLDEDESAVLLDGGHHGSELMSTELAVDSVQQLLERYAADPAIRSLVDQLAIWVVPLVNPDGNMRFVHEMGDVGRKNGRDVDENGVADPWDGVDLYRNYPVRWGGLGEVGSRSNPFHHRYRGPFAASEPEVQAMMKLAGRERFIASIDFHTNATKILPAYTDPSFQLPRQNEVRGVAEEIAARLPEQVNGRRYEVVRNLYPVDGTAQDWFRFAFGTVALLVEAPTHNPLPYAKARNPAVVGTRPSWQILLERVANGPGVSGLVRDERGAPVVAEVEIVEMPAVNGEVWTTRPRDGRYARLFPSPGRWTVRVRAAGYQTVERLVQVTGPSVARLDVVLVPAR